MLGFAHEQHEANGKFSEQEKADLIELMAGQSQEVANIVDDLLIAARAETGSITVSPEAVPVRSLVGEVLPSHSGRVDFSMSSDEDVEVWADPVRTRQVLRNLRTNADLYGGNKVMVHVTKGEDQVSIEVLDDGEGIPESMQDHVFEPYARAHNGRSQPASVGLGLSVARSLAQLMDGDLVLSCDDGWTVFTVALHSFQRDEPPGPPPNVALDNRRIVVRV